MSLDYYLNKMDTRGPQTLEKPTGLAYDPEFQDTMGVSEEMWNTYNPTEQTGIMNSATGLRGLEGPGFDVGDWFSKNKSMVGAGIGLGQLGLGILNYQANKKGLESDLASAKQARRLTEERAQNKRNIQGKAQTALRWS